MPAFFYFLLSILLAGISIYFFYDYFRNREFAKQKIEEENLRKEQERIKEEQRANQERIAREEQEKYILSCQECFKCELNKIPRVPISITNNNASNKSIEQLYNISFSRITKKTNIERLFPFVVIDVETTGLHHKKDEIIEVSAIKYESCFEPDSCFTTLCHPSCLIPQSATTINHITDEMVSNAPQFYQISNSFSDFISNCNLVGHNLYFDLEFLCANGINFSKKRRYFDTLELSKLTFSRDKFLNYRYDMNMDVYSFKLDVLCDFINVFRDDSHRSLSDCLATGKLFEKIISQRTSDTTL